MSRANDETNYRLKLVEGDVIEALVTNLGRHGAQVDTTLWSNVDTATLNEVGQSTSIAPGSEINATVTEIDSGEATLKRKRGLYRRNHLPGDNLRVRGNDRVSSSLVRAAPDEFRNLDVIFVPGIAVGADVTVEIAKIRDSTAFALPIDVHDPGLTPGRTVTVQTTAGNSEATVEMLYTRDGDEQPPHDDFSIRLSDPAPATGQMTATLTTVTDDGIRGELERDAISLPSAGTIVTTPVRQGHGRTSVNLTDSEFEIRIRFEHPCPIDGEARVELGDRQDGVYRATLIRYTRPDLQRGTTYQARIYKSKEKAQIKRGDRKIPIMLTHDVSTTGQAMVQVTELDDAIYGHVEGEIEPLAFDTSDSGTTDVDITNVSKL